MQSGVNNDTLHIPAKLYRIGELVSYTPFSRQTIHNYTIMGLLREAERTEGGHRLYDQVQCDGSFLPVRPGHSSLFRRVIRCLN